jgi:hypothetical protein
MKLIIIIAGLSLMTLFSCSQDEAAIPIDPNTGIGGNDDLRPGPTPQPTPLPPPVPTPKPVENVVLTIEPSSLNKNDTTLVYRKMFNVVGLGEPRSGHRSCDSRYSEQCAVNQQILWQFSTEDINENYPQELWDVGKVEMTASYYSVGKNHRTELLCLLNNRFCSGKAISRLPRLGLPFLKILWRNHNFWTGRDEDHVRNQLFHDILLAGQDGEEFFRVSNHTLDFSRFFSMHANQVQTLVRKNDGIQMSVTDDTFVEDPILKVYLKRRVPRN